VTTDLAQVVDQALARRYTAPYLLSEYTTRQENEYYTTWKDSTKVSKELYRGNIAKVFPEEKFAARIGPLLMNLPMTFTDDLVRLVSESTPTLRCRPRKDTTTAQTTAHIEEAVGMTYWEEGGGDELTPFHTGDISVAGCAFMAVKTQSDCDYPIPMRLDPAGCYPTWDGPNLVDLMVVEEITGTEAEFRFGDAYTAQWDESTYGTERIRVMEWYRPDGTITALVAVDSGNRPKSAYFVKAVKRTRLAVAGVRRATADGVMRGMFSQSNAKIMIAARLISQIFDANDYAIYSQPVQRDTDWEQVKDQPWKPITLQTEAAVFQNQPPRQLNPQSFELLQFLEGQIRSEIGYPDARQGEVSQSIASASFVGSVLGQLTTNVRDVARYLGMLRERWTNLAYQVDRQVLNYEKPLCRPVGKKAMYTPGADFSDYPKCKVIFGTGAGLDKLNQMAASIRNLGYGIVSKETIMETMDEISDVEAEKVRIAKEQWDEALMKQALADPTFGVDGFMAVSEELGKGTAPDDALRKIIEERKALAQQMAQQGGMAVPPEQEAQASPIESQNASLVRGGGPESEGQKGMGNAPPPGNEGGGLPPLDSVVMPQ
jgi:hypothetical protein